MRTQSAAPPGGSGGSGYRQGYTGSAERSARIIPFRQRALQSALTGFFWSLPPAQQRERIKQLARSLSPEYVATLCRVPLSQVLAICDEGAPL